MTQTETHVRIGTSGYNYEGWRGVLYPHNLKTADMLSFYASKFDTVEINTSFYGIPSKSSAKRMISRVPQGFEFFVKANQEFTHKGNLQDVTSYLNWIEPFQDSQCLAGVLFQFPAAFVNSQSNWSHISRLRSEFRDVPMAIEFRHVSWSKPDVLTFLSDQNLTHVVADLPEIPYLYRRHSDTIFYNSPVLREYCVWSSVVMQV